MDATTRPGALVMQIPHYEPIGNGDEIYDDVFVGPDGRITFGHAYSGRQVRLRHSAQKDEMLCLGPCRVRIEPYSEGDL